MIGNLLILRVFIRLWNTPEEFDKYSVTVYSGVDTMKDYYYSIPFIVILISMIAYTHSQYYSIDNNTEKQQS